MRQLIDVEFKDATSYPDQAGGDVGGIVIDHYTGPVEARQTVNFQNFQRLFPAVQGKRLTASYVNAYRAFQTGISTLEVVRLQGKYKYFQLILTEQTAEGESQATLKPTTSWVKTPAIGETSPFLIRLKYPGPLVGVLSAGETAQITVSVKTTGTNIDGVPDITISLEKTSGEGANKVIEVIESFQGGWGEGLTLDGTNYSIDQVMASSQYLAATFDYSASISTLSAFSAPYSEDSTVVDGPYVTEEELCTAYSAYFSDIEQSVATILMDPGTTTVGNAALIQAVAEQASNRVALVGYPTGETFSKEALTTYFATATKGMFSAYYALREKVTIMGIAYASNGIGAVAGCMASVAMAESVNQLPSAKTWGSFAGALTDALSFEEVLEIQKAGINTAYSSPTGPRLFGVRSAYVRSTSYFSKFNVDRVIARVLQYAFNVAIDVIHTGNTDSRKILTQNLLRSDLNTLIAQGALKIESTVQCDASNNPDTLSKGGEVLIIDYTLYPVKLIERLKVRVMVTDTSVSAEIS